MSLGSGPIGSAPLGASPASGGGPPPDPFDPADGFGEDVYAKPFRHRANPSQGDWSVEAGTLVQAEFDAVTSQMGWESFPAIVNRQLRRKSSKAKWLPATVSPEDFSTELPSTAQEMSWDMFVMVKPYRVGHRRACGRLNPSYETLQAHYGGALVAGIEMRNSIGNKRIEASGTVVAGRGIGTIP